MAGRQPSPPTRGPATVRVVEADAVAADGLTLRARVVIAGTHSGVGKTTVTTGLLRALHRGGHRPAAAKVGPDFIDPGYHALACGRAPRNLDPWMCGVESVPALAARAASGAGVLVVEGVMGLFDGAADGSPSSTADVARLLEAPIVLVVDASALSGSVAALVHGYATHDPSLQVAGVVLNRVASDRHDAMLRAALEGGPVPVVGSLRRDDAFSWRDRHLGLVPVTERPEEVSAVLERLADAVAGGLDLSGILAIAASAPSRRAPPVALPRPGPPIRVGVAGGQAFSFTYTDTLDALAAAGAEVVVVDPLRDRRLPDGLNGLVLGGGFPEVYANELAANGEFLADLAERVAAGLPTWAECGGLLLLCRRLDDRTMAGVITADARMTARLRLGYRVGTTAGPSPIGPPGTTLRGHEFHYSTVEPAGEGIELTGSSERRSDGWTSPTMIATYLHHHPGGDPSLIEHFAAGCAAAGCAAARR